MNRVVVTLHGIETTGLWQKQVAPLLCHFGMTPYLLDYGKFSKWQLMRDKERSAKVDWLNNEIQDIRKKEGVDRVSVIAHSFGTFLIASALKKYSQVRLDNVIFCGSIVDPAFDWSTVLGRHQLGSLRNEIGGEDFWAGITKYMHLVIKDAGPSGRRGFEQESLRIVNEVQFRHYRHSDFFQPGHCEGSWFPFLKQLNLCDEDQEALRRVLDVGVRQIANSLGISSTALRANVMVPTLKDDLYIPIGLGFPSGRFHSSSDGDELDIRIPIGQGAAGVAFKERKMVVALFEPGWLNHPIPEAELKKAHPDLRWILSAPIPDFDDRMRFRMSGVLNIDCIGQSKTEGELDTPRTRNDLKLIAEQIGEFLHKLL